MSQENVEIVRRIFAGWAKGDLSAEADAFDQNIVHVVSSDFPAWGVNTGRDALRAFMRDFLAQWDQVTFTLSRVRAVGDTVLADVVQHGRGRASGVTGDLKYFMLFTFRGEKIVRYDSVMHEPEALEALGLSEQDAHAEF